MKKVLGVKERCDIVRNNKEKVIKYYLKNKTTKTAVKYKVSQAFINKMLNEWGVDRSSVYNKKIY